MRMIGRWTFGLIIGVLTAVFSGCGDGLPARVPVAGRVLIDGQPVEHGFVQVIPRGDRAAVGELGPGGTFRLTTFEPNDGCVLGDHAVAVIGMESIDSSSQRWHAPKKYADPETSELRANIQGPTDSLEINLSWDGEAPYVERFESE
jgi:hypothetical protein